jgi:O-antigen ligase
MVDSLEKLKKSCFVVLASMFIASLYIYNGYIRWGENRPGGIVGDPNYYAMIAISILPMAILLQANSRGIIRFFLIATAISLAASTLLGGSRAGLLGICLSAGYLIQYMRQRLLVFSIGALTLTVLLLVLPTSPLQRLLNPTREAVSSSSLRTRIFKAGMEMIRDHPITGVGIAQFKATSVKYTPELTVTASGRRSRYDGHIAHNTYLNVAAELGIAGLIVFLAILASSWRRARKLARWAATQSPPPTTAIQIARAIEAGLVGYGFTAIFLTADYIKHAWILIFFGMALNRIMLFQYPVLARRGPAGAAGVSQVRPAGAASVHASVPRRIEPAI